MTLGSYPKKDGVTTDWWLLCSWTDGSGGYLGPYTEEEAQKQYADLKPHSVHMQLLQQETKVSTPFLQEYYTNPNPPYEPWEKP